MTAIATPELYEFLLNNGARPSPDAITTVQGVLCNAATWSAVPTLAQVVASKLTEANGYTAQDASPAGDSTSSGNGYVMTFANVSFSLSSSTLDYTGFAIILSTAGGEVGALTKKFTTTKTIDSAGAAHPFDGLTFSLGV
jgi:hypothetical protein